MAKVAECVAEIPEIFEAYRRQDSETVESLANKISRLEHEADVMKSDIRNSLPRGLFMPIDRVNLLQILNIQDSIANRAENIAVLLTLKQAKTFEQFEADFDDLVAKCLDAFTLARKIIDELDELLETGFGGIEAQNVKQLVDMVAFKEHETDVIQGKLLRSLLANEDSVSYGDFFLWTRIIRQVAGLADRAEGLANAIRMTLESK
jgi:predicted phosphate transport protein (TIGR00153 family)